MRFDGTIDKSKPITWLDQQMLRFLKIQHQKKVKARRAVQKSRRANRV